MQDYREVLLARILEAADEIDLLLEELEESIIDLTNAFADALRAALESR